MSEEKTEKAYTLRTALAELNRLKKTREQKKAKIEEAKKKVKTLTDEMKAENAKIKEMEAVYDKLYHDDLQKRISDEWFKKGGMTAEQIEKFLALSKQIQDKIDILDVDTVVQAVTSAYNEQTQNDNQGESLPETPSDADGEKVATCGNFSESNSGKETSETKSVISLAQTFEVRRGIT